MHKPLRFLGGWHRYTRWTGRLSHQTSNLSHPCNPLLEGCHPCFTWYQVQGGVGSDLPNYRQTTKVILTEGSPERSGYMHMDKQVIHSILDMLFSMRGTKTAKVEGLQLINRPKCLVPDYPDDSPKVWWCSPFILPSLYSMRDPHDIMIICSDPPVGKPLHMHIRTTNIHLCICQHPCQNPQILWMHPNLFVSSLTQFLHLWHSPQVFQCVLVLEY